MRGLALSVNSNVPLVRLEIQGDGTERAFAVQGGTLLITLRKPERENPLTVTAITAQGLKVGPELLPDNVDVWNIQLDGGPTTSGEKKPVPWKPIAIGTGALVALALLWKWYTAKDAPPQAMTFEDTMRAGGYRMIGSDNQGMTVWGRER